MKRQLKRNQQGRGGFQYIVDPQTRRDLQPFVFFDAGVSKRNDEGMFFGMHPHSGIGIITYFEGGNLVHQDSGNNDDIIKSGGVQWINAGNGIFHAEGYRMPKGVNPFDSWELAIHQLWLQLPPELENGSTGYLNLQPENIPLVDNVKVIAGEYKGVKSNLDIPFDITYLDVSLKEGEKFVLETPLNQTRGFIFLRSGEASIYEDELTTNTLHILEENDGEIEIIAKENTKFVIGLTVPTDHKMFLGGGSIHTNKLSFEKAQENIQSLSSTVI
ncbi:pirin family protein [Flammeovirga agarivorans]|uniref:Pirin family protein n=1 Tax=Flammeovirga agarivorans TaxID=2726742 RepID=A0A7X8SHC5_9BACT|nr:pirin family protein [Flammeovirga agarivorans]NLR90235.1 pirin family protein [Flammeovirga agarivorans]